MKDEEGRRKKEGEEGEEGEEGKEPGRRQGKGEGR